MAPAQRGRTGFRCSLRDRAQLEALVGEDLPAGLRETTRITTAHRDLYFDTADRTMQKRNAAIRFRFHLDGHAELSLMPGGHAGFASSAPVTARVDAGDLAAALAADTAPGRGIRGLVDPLLLGPRLELEVSRVRRDARAGFWPRERFTFCYDDVTIRHGEGTRAFQELKVTCRGPGSTRLERISRELADRHGLRPAITTRLERAEAIRVRLADEALQFRIGPGNAIVTAVLNGNEIAVTGEGDGIQLPGGPGAGEAACRQALHAHFQSRVGELHRVGTVSTPGGDRTIEVWLVRRVRGAAGEAAPAGISWVPLERWTDAIARGDVRDAVTIAAWRLLADAALPGDARARRRPAAAGPPPRAADITTDDFLDGPLSELAFIERVVALAEDARVPLIECIRYLAIVSANLDEFYMGTAGGLRHAARSPDDREVVRLSDAVQALLARQTAALARCVADLTESGVTLRTWGTLAEPARIELRRYFEREIFPQLTPRAITVSPGHPFPIIPALTLGFAVELAADDRPAQFAYLRLPPDLPRFLPVTDADSAADLLPVEELVRAELGRVYPDRRIAAAALFRITRLSDLDVDEAGAGNLLQAMEEDVTRRRSNPVSRVEIESAAPPGVLETLLRELRFERDAGAAPGTGPEVQRVDGLLALSSLRELADAVPDGSAAAFPPFTPRHPLPAGQPVWERIRAGDLLVHHPYDDFESTVVRVVADAAADPDVVAIRMTLYRAGDRSPLVDALQLAARNGKDVSVFVELKARFDEARNVLWVRRLEAAGAQVVYGLVGLKNHAKVAMVVRRELDGICRYVHIGTGNYNAGTARVYTDLGLLTADPAIGEDVNDFFNQLTGMSGPPAARFQQLLVAPVRLLPELLERIDREARHARDGGHGRIRIKCNGLADPDVVRALYRASEAGVAIEAVVRGICTLRPGVPGLSGNIRVTSILGRFLEHARIYAFDNAGDPEYFIGSADLRPRNLRRRIEVLVPIRDAHCRDYLDRVLGHELNDPTAWALGSDGRYAAPAGSIGDAASTQQLLIDGRITEGEERWLPAL